MKKSLIILSSLFLVSMSSKAQTTTPTETPKQENFDKKFRFGIRATPQVAWLSSDNDNAKGAGSTMSFGFGLILDFKLSDIIHFSTGIGGDFDGGKLEYKYKVDNTNPTNNFNISMALDKENNMLEAKDGTKAVDYIGGNGNSFYSMNTRKYKSTYITLPILLKMMTQEYNGLKHAFHFGGEIGIRAGLKANDTYHEGFKTAVTGSAVTTETLTGGQLEINGLDVSRDGSGFPARVGMNVGYGIEYRLGGSTSLYTGISYFHSFTNLVKKDSEFLSKGHDNTTNSDGTITFANLNQAYFARAVRLSIGLMF